MSRRSEPQTAVAAPARAPGLPSNEQRAHDLAGRAAAGDLEATQEFLAYVWPTLTRVAAGVLGARHPDLDDAVQQSMIAVVRALPAFRGECHPAGYATRITLRVSLRVRRNVKRDASGREALGQPDPSRDAELYANDDALDSRRRELLRELLEDLPEEQAEALTLRVVMGWTLEEVARASGAPVNTVRSRVRLAKEALRARIEARPALAELEGIAVTVVGIHPEELFDKLQDRGLSAAERERLRAHLDGCAVCRFEYAARLDFQGETLELSVTSPLPSLPLRPLTLNEAESEPRAARLTLSRRRRSRVIGWRLAAAALISASAAVASGVVGAAPWHAARLWFSQAAKPSEGPAASPPKKTTSAAAARAPAAATEVSPSAEESTTAPAPLAGARAVAAEARVGGRAKQVAKARPLAATEAPLLAAVPPSSGDVSSAKDGASKEPTSKEPPSAAKLFGEANQARRSGDVGRASGLYHLLQDQFSGSPEAELSRVTLALLLLDNGDAQAALSGFERYLAGSSRGLEAEALVGRARALARLGRRDLEVSAWREVQRKYPRSIYGRQASERLSALGLP